MELPERVLSHLSGESGPVNSLHLSRLWSLDHQRVVGAVKSLQSLEGFIRAESVTEKRWELTKEGREVADKGSHEAVVFNAVPGQGIGEEELKPEMCKSMCLILKIRV